MSGKEKISVVINTYNAERHLRPVLDSLKGFDEVVVCDMESTDSTVEIATSYGCKVVTFPKGNYTICEPARNFAIQSAAHEWVLVVDADEVVTPELRDYLYARIARGDCPEGLRVLRRNKFMGRFTHSMSDYQTRFLRKEKVNWPPIIHCRPEVDGVVEKIPTSAKGACFLHLDDAPIASRLTKQNVYSDNEVPKRLHKQYSGFALIYRPVWFFVKHYFKEGGWRDGKRGVIAALMASVYQITLLAKVMERQWEEKEK